MRTILACGVAWFVGTLASPMAGSSVTITREAIGAPLGDGCTVLVDVDGDGRRDIVERGPDTLHAHRRAGSNPVELIVAADPTVPAGGAYLGGCTAADLDEDGALDLVTARRSGNGTSAELLWLRNPGSATRPWVEQVLGTHPGAVPGDVVAGDLDGDGTFDVAARSTDALMIWTAAVTTSGRSWTAHPVTVAGGRGLLAADADGDGDTDLLAGSVLLEQRPDRTWPATPLGSGATATAASGDVDGDGRDELVIGPLARSGPVSVLRHDAGRWMATPILDVTTAVVTSLALADLDGDGDDDLVVDAPVGPGRAWLVTAGRWDPVIVEEPGLRAIAVGELDGDDAAEIVGTSGAGPLVRIDVVIAPPTTVTRPPSVEITGGPTPGPTTTTAVVEPEPPATTTASQPPAPADARDAATPTTEVGGPVIDASVSTVRSIGAMPTPAGPPAVDNAVGVLPEALVRTAELDLRRVVVAVVALVGVVGAFAALRPRGRERAALARAFSAGAAAAGGPAATPDRGAPTGEGPAS